MCVCVSMCVCPKILKMIPYIPPLSIQILSSDVFDSQPWTFPTNIDSTSSTSLAPPLQLFFNAITYRSILSQWNASPWGIGS